MLFYDNNGYKNALQHYIVSTSPLLFIIPYFDSVLLGRCQDRTLEQGFRLFPNPLVTINLPFHSAQPTQL
jgi:hypothetical protein